MVVKEKKVWMLIELLSSLYLGLQVLKRESFFLICCCLLLLVGVCCELYFDYRKNKTLSNILQIINVSICFLCFPYLWMYQLNAILCITQVLFYVIGIFIGYRLKKGGNTKSQYGVNVFAVVIMSIVFRFLNQNMMTIYYLISLFGFGIYIGLLLKGGRK